MYDQELPSIANEDYPKANREHRCCECMRKISRGDKYQRIKGCWDGEWATYKTCMDCVDLRHQVTDPTEGAPAFGCLVEALQEHGLSLPKAV